MCWQWPRFDALITAGPGAGTGEGDLAREYKLDAGAFRSSRQRGRPGTESRAVVMRADALVLFGATGDLARKKLFPALYQLAAAGRARKAGRS